MKQFWRQAYYLFLILTLLISCKKDDGEPSKPGSKNFALKDLSVDGLPIRFSYSDISITPTIVITFSEPIDHASAQTYITFVHGNTAVPITLAFSHGDSTVTATPVNALSFLTAHNFRIDANLTSSTKKTYGASTATKIVTKYDPSDKFPIISDDQLLDLIQQKTFNYFWDGAHEASGMARERNTSGNIVTTGGSGFGVMTLLVGIERGFITRDEGIARLQKIVGFLETADRFHGAWPHWINGDTGKVVPFSSNDNGADLVETSFMIHGLLTVRQYLNAANDTEAQLAARIDELWKAVEWDWFTRGGQHVLYWHWSPDKDWIMNLPIHGYNECLITYVLAASSPTHGVAKEVYTEGFANNGDMKNGKTFYNYVLPLGEDYGGPLFFSHYSYLGLDPRNLKDTYANFWEQNVNHTLINYSYCVANPRKYAGYGADCWGLTASDDSNGYSAHSPTNDLGVISPTAAVSSIPYSPDESMNAIRFFYYKLGDKLFGTYGFYDAFELSDPWFATSYLAIDQGPQVVMIENYRTQLLWNLFMTSPDVQAGLTELGFTY